MPTEGTTHGPHRDLLQDGFNPPPGAVDDGREIAERGVTANRLTAPMPLRVLLIGALPPPFGGTTVLLQSLLDELRAKPGEVAVEMITTGTRVDSGLIARVRSLLSSLVRFLWLVRGCDVVSIHLSSRGRVFLGPLVLAVCRLLGRPLVVRCFGGSLDRAYATGSTLHRWALRRILGADYVLVETRILERFVNSLDTGARVVWYTNSRNIADYRKSPGRDRQLRIVCLGEVSRAKGVGLLLDAVSRLRDRELSIGVFGRLVDLSAADVTSAHPGASYGGELKPHEVKQRLGDYDVLVMPTQISTEGYPGVIIEAYAAGLAVVASDLPQIREIVEPERTGLLFDMGASDRLALVLERLLDDSQLVDRLKAGAAKRAYEFDATVQADRFIALCRAAAEAR